ncbi:hypothetical protein K474DRAFT_181872 [Panus rudis PR-1116 ss-1]|nr:hypothetical protein K474DRAFT_181872 [Panus rudis PR-1116 ss-1]
MGCSARIDLLARSRFCSRCVPFLACGLVLGRRRGRAQKTWDSDPIQRIDGDLLLKAPSRSYNHFILEGILTCRVILANIFGG